MGSHQNWRWALQNLLPEVRVWNEQIAQFKPDWRHLAHNLVICPGAPSGVVSAYNLLRTEALKRLRQNHWNTVAVTSPSRVSGNTLTAFNLAISMARDFGQSVLLVELNLVTPSFHRILGLGQRQGVADYLLHDASLSEILLDIGVERLAVIPAGSPVANSSELLSSPRMAQFVEEIRGRHGRLIALFDLPSVLAVDAAAAFSPLVDCALLVIEEGETRVDDVRRALRHLEATKILRDCAQPLNPRRERDRSHFPLKRPSSRRIKDRLERLDLFERLLQLASVQAPLNASTRALIRFISPLFC